MTLHIRRLGRLFCCLVVIAAAARASYAADPAKTLIQDTIYLADGSVASGTILISWPAFVTSEAVSQREIVDEDKFRDGLGKVIDGVVQCFNASAWAKAK